MISASYIGKSLSNWLLNMMPALFEPLTNLSQSKPLARQAACMRAMPNWRKSTLRCFPWRRAKCPACYTASLVWQDKIHFSEYPLIRARTLLCTGCLGVSETQRGLYRADHTSAIAFQAIVLDFPNQRWDEIHQRSQILHFIH
jgi:hypothetical protein